MNRKSYLYALVMLCLIWFFVSWKIIPQFIPTPIKTVIYIVNHYQELSKHLLVSLLRIMVAMTISIALGGFLGIITARNKFLDQCLSPMIYALYPVPKIALLPLIMLLFGIGNVSKVILIFLILFFQIVVGIRDAVKHIHQGYFLSMRSLGATRWQIYRHVVFPAFMPSLFTALRIGIGTGISVLFFAENYATDYGIGYFIMNSWLRINYTAMFAGILCISILGLLLFASVDLLEKYVCPWKENERIGKA